GNVGGVAIGQGFTGGVGVTTGGCGVDVGVGVPSVSDGGSAVSDGEGVGDGCSEGVSLAGGGSVGALPGTGCEPPANRGCVGVASGRGRPCTWARVSFCCVG